MRGHRKIVLKVGSCFESTCLYRYQACFNPQTTNSLVTGGPVILFFRDPFDLSMSIGLTTVAEDVPNQSQQRFIVLLAVAVVTLPPLVEGAPADLEYLAHLLAGELEAALLNEVILHFTSVAKLRLAFLEIAFSYSRSCLRRLISRISSPAGCRLPLPGNVFGAASLRYSLIHRRMLVVVMPISLANSTGDRPNSQTRCTITFLDPSLGRLWYLLLDMEPLPFICHYRVFPCVRLT